MRSPRKILTAMAVATIPTLLGSLWWGGANAFACTDGTADCLEYYDAGAAGAAGDVTVSPKVWVFCPGWNCGDHTVDTYGYVVDSANQPNGALPAYFRAIGGSKWLNGVTQYYQDAPNYGYANIQNPTSLYQGYIANGKKLPSQVCSADADCVSGKCAPYPYPNGTKYCVKSCRNGADCNATSGSCVGGLCECTQDANCGGAYACLFYSTGDMVHGYCQDVGAYDMIQSAWDARSKAGTSDPNAIFAIQMPPGLTNYEEHGTWHGSAIPASGTPTLYFQNTWGNTNSEIVETAAQGAIEVAHHELVETITDPGKWNSSSYYDIAWQNHFPAGGSTREAADACGDTPETSNKSCTSGSDCWPLTTCSAGHCVDSCAADADCQGGGASYSNLEFRCVNTTTLGHRCRSIYRNPLANGYTIAIDSSTNRYPLVGFASDATRGLGECVFARATRHDQFVLISGTKLRQIYNYDPAQPLEVYADWDGPSGVTLIGDVTAASSAPGRVDVFVKDLWSTNIEYGYSTDNGSHVTWTSLASGCSSAMSNPEATSPQPGVVNLFIRCKNSSQVDQLKVITMRNGSWGTWKVITPSAFAMDSGPSAVSWSPDRSDIVILGHTGSDPPHLWEGYTTDLTNFSYQWNDLDSGYLNGSRPSYGGDPDMGSWMQGHLDIAVSDLGGNVYLIEYDETKLATTQGWWRYALNTPPSSYTIRVNPGVVGMGDFRVAVSAVDSNGDVWLWKYMDQESSGSWISTAVGDGYSGAGAVGGIDLVTW